jgi:hypothetical protein
MAANVYNVTAATSSTQLFAASASADPRATLQRIVKNDSSALLYVKFGTGASATSYTQDVVAGATYELPRPVYPGVVEGIWVAANGAARCTEVS